MEEEFTEENNFLGNTRKNWREKCLIQNEAATFEISGSVRDRK